MSKNVWLKNTIVRWKPARKASQRFVAGETLDQAIEAVRTLNQQGINATLDQLGENTNSADDAAQFTNEIIKIIDAIVQSDVRSNVSVKLSQIGLTLDEASCETNLRQILTHASKSNLFVRIDMEGSDLTEKTFTMYQRMIEVGFTNVGIVLQAYLYRSALDIERLSSWGGKVRLCKGAYKEPATIAFPKKSAVDRNFDLLTQMLFDSALTAKSPLVSSDGRIPPIPALATHDAQRIDFAQRLLKQLGLPKDAVEFQMLYGIRRDLQQQIVKAGFPVRVYVPFGTHWYPYFMRRLAERPANLWFFISSYLRK